MMTGSGGNKSPRVGAGCGSFLNGGLLKSRYGSLQSRIPSAVWKAGAVNTPAWYAHITGFMDGGE